MFNKVKVWDNREQRRINGRLVITNGRSWTRRITWLENAEGQVKFKLEDGDQYREVMVSGGAGPTIWDRFKAGQPIDDCVSILGSPVPKALMSKRGKDPRDESERAFDAADLSSQREEGFTTKLISRVIGRHRLVTWRTGGDGRWMIVQGPMVGLELYPESRRFNRRLLKGWAWVYSVPDQPPLKGWRRTMADAIRNAEIETLGPPESHPVT